MPLDLVPAFLMGVLAAWLGLSLLVRAPRDAAARAFAWLCLNLALYGMAIVIGRMSESLAVVRPIAHRVEILETVLLPPVWLQFIGVVVGSQPWPRLRRVVLILFYTSGAALALYALFSPQMNLAAAPPRFPSITLVTLSVFQRVLPLGFSLWLVARDALGAGDDPPERSRRSFFAFAVLIAVSGALLASLARELRFTQAPGHLLMDAGLAMMAYMVLAYRLLLPVRVARRTFIRSLLGSGMTIMFILAVLLIEPLVSSTLAIKTPLLTVFALVALVAVFGPLRDAAGAWLDQRLFHREFDYGRLLKEVSDDLFERGDLTGQLDAALAAICRTLDVRAGAVAVRENAGLKLLATYGTDRPDLDALRTIALPDAPETFYGDWLPWPAARLLLPLRQGEHMLGLLALGPKRSDAAYGEVERVLLDSLGRYLALTIVHARTQQEEELAMAVLAAQSHQLQAEQALLETHAAETQRLLAEACATPAAVPVPVAGLRVAALGSLRVEHGGMAIERWGGDKAGNHQSEALFAFLFDRRGKGLTKDEAEEVIWPDLDMEKADTAFHRTLSALRRTLEPGLRRGNESKQIAYHHERYWLDPAGITWCDVDEYARAVERGQTLLRQNDLAAARTSFEQATALYRGDYMDDCPFFGDSADVEQRREDLRRQHVGTLLALGSIYEQIGFAGEATTAYRRAIVISQDDCPKAEEALERLAMV